MAENDLKRAENRVREMNELTQNYVRQGNTYMQNMRNSSQNNNSPTHLPPNSEPHQTRFETVNTSNTVKNINNSNQTHSNKRNTNHSNIPPPQKENKSHNHNTNFAPENNHENIHKNHPQSINSPDIHKLIGNIFSNLNINDEKLIIIALIIILAGEKADMKLIIALAYIIM